MWEAIKFVWQVDDSAGWKLARLQQWFMGTVKGKKFGAVWTDTQLKDNPATAEEVVAFGHWYRFNNPGLTLPGKGDTLRDYFETYKGGAEYEQYLRKARNTIIDKIPKFTSPGIDLEREQANQPTGDIMILTEGQKAEIKAAYASIGKGSIDD